MTRDKTADHRHFVAADQLRIGLFIFIDLPWFQHPFTLNSFRIASDDQVRTLQSLGEERFRYDPERSLPPKAPPATRQTPLAAIAGKETGTPIDADDPPPLFIEKQMRIRLIGERRSRIEQVNRDFLKTAASLRNMNRNLIGAPNETIKEMASLVDRMTVAFLENPEVTLHLMCDDNGSDEAYSHSLNVAVLSMMLTKGLAFSADQARILGLGALLHDIGLVEIPDRLLKMRPHEFTRPERELRAMHCEYGLRIGKQLGLAPDVLAIIFQHHEMSDGSGYPTGVKEEKIALPARVVALVNHYDNLCNPVDHTQALTPHEALSLLFGQRRSKFDAAILQRLIRCLGVYPPGSIVTLSNDAVALVMSVNPERPLRPWVMLYDEKVPKEEAVLLDLENETGINITKALRPAMLPPPIQAYLSSRKRVAYFFDSSAPSGQATP